MKQRRRHDIYMTALQLFYLAVMLLALWKLLTQ